MDQTKLIAQVEHKMPSLEGPGIAVKGDGVAQLESIISGVFGILTVVAVIFFAIQIILAGYLFISSEGDKEKILQARKKLTNNILGITIVAVAFGLGAFLAKLLGIQNVFDLQQSINLLKLN